MGLHLCVLYLLFIEIQTIQADQMAYTAIAVIVHFPVPNPNYLQSYHRILPIPGVVSWDLVHNTKTSCRFRVWALIDSLVWVGLGLY